MHNESTGAKPIFPFSEVMESVTRVDKERNEILHNPIALIAPHCPELKKLHDRMNEMEKTLIQVLSMTAKLLTKL